MSFITGECSTVFVLTYESFLIITNIKTQYDCVDLVNLGTIFKIPQKFKDYIEQDVVYVTTTYSHCKAKIVILIFTKID